MIPEPTTAIEHTEYVTVLGCYMEGLRFGVLSAVSVFNGVIEKIGN